MPVIQVHELAGRTREGYADAMRELALPGPPPGSHLHASGPMDGGWRIVEVWESEAAAGAFYGSEAFQRRPGAWGSRRTSSPAPRRDRADVTPGAAGAGEGRPTPAAPGSERPAGGPASGSPCRPGPRPPGRSRLPRPRRA